MVLLSRVADRIYWAARYIERAEDAARVLRSFGDVLADIPTHGIARWNSLVAVAGSETVLEPEDGSDERPVVHFLIADPDHSNSILNTVESCRENLRTCREVLPREAWQTVNDLSIYVRSTAATSIGRRAREAFLMRVVNDSRRLDGVLTVAMTRDAAYEMWRLGRYIERGDMTTRVLGVRAATLLQLPPGGHDEFAEVRWMSVLRSLSALQMYQRASPGPIDGPDVVRFLLFDHQFPRSVAGCLAEIRSSVLRLPANETVLHMLERADRELKSCRPAADDGHELDDAMDRVQLSLAGLHDALAARYLRF
ncbi:MAG: alpha-E domain-containing protein [Ilumatobacter sp.]|nr:alpha-E domain-containing protein [Ilumatobacter sp.]